MFADINKFKGPYCKGPNLFEGAYFDPGTGGLQDSISVNDGNSSINFFRVVLRMDREQRERAVADRRQKDVARCECNPAVITVIDRWGLETS